jgi:hypothetical protein
MQEEDCKFHVAVLISSQNATILNEYISLISKPRGHSLVAPFQEHDNRSGLALCFSIQRSRCYRSLVS